MGRVRASGRGCISGRCDDNSTRLCLERFADRDGGASIFERSGGILSLILYEQISESQGLRDARISRALFHLRLLSPCSTLEEVRAHCTSTLRAPLPPGSALRRSWIWLRSRSQSQLIHGILDNCKASIVCIRSCTCCTVFCIWISSSRFFQPNAASCLN